MPGTGRAPKVGGSRNPGIGPIVATALVAEVGDWKAFSSGRNLAAWIGLVPKQHSTGGKERLGDFKTGQPIFAMAARCGRNGCHPIRASARHEAALARAYHEPPANQSRSRSRWPTRSHVWPGPCGSRGAVQGTKITTGSGLAEREQRASTNWRGHDDVMQIRSFRGSGEPARVIASSNARDGLGPGFRRHRGQQPWRFNRPDT